MPEQGTQRRQPSFQRTRDSHELKEKAIFGDKTSAISDEMNPANASGFLDETELKLIRRYQSMLSHLRYIENSLGIDLNRMKDFILEKMNFLTHSSKSKDGAGVKAAISEIMIQDQNVYQSVSEENKEKEGFFQKLMKFGERAQSGGQTEFGRNIQYRKNKDNKIWR